MKTKMTDQRILYPIVSQGTTFVIEIPATEVGHIVKAKQNKINKLEADIARFGSRCDTITDATPDHIAKDLRDKYLTAIEAWLDEIDIIKKMKIEVKRNG